MQIRVENSLLEHEQYVPCDKILPRGKLFLTFPVHAIQRVIIHPVHRKGFELMGSSF